MPRRVDWVDKYFQIGSVYYFTQSDSEKRIGYGVGDFICGALFCLGFGDLVELFKGPQRLLSSNQPPSPPHTTVKIAPSAVELMWHEEKWAVPAPARVPQV